MPRRRPIEDDPDLGRWAISWADFMTLLVAFFVVMYGISSVNQEKYRQLSESLNAIFERAPVGTPTDPSAVIGDASGVGLLEGGQQQVPSESVYVESPDGTALTRLRDLQAKLSSSLVGLFQEGDLEIQGNELWIQIEIRSSLLFEAGDVIPAIEADPLLSRIAEILKRTDSPIHVEGYTDNQPVSTDRFPSNWELSAARAAAVVRLLQLDGLNPERMAAVGFGEYHPKYSNRTAEGQQLNRRLVIVVSRDERVRTALLSAGSGGVGEDTVKSLLVPTPVVDDNALEQVDTETGIIFRRAEINATQEQ